MATYARTSGVDHPTIQHSELGGSESPVLNSSVDTYRKTKTSFRQEICAIAKLSGEGKDGKLPPVISRLRCPGEINTAKRALGKKRGFRSAPSDADLIESIYAAAIEPSRWIDVIGILRKRFPGAKVIISSEDTRTRVNLGTLQAGFDVKVLNDYAAHYAGLNPWIPFFATTPVLVPLISDDVFPSWTFRDSEFWDGFMRPETEVESATGMKLFHDEDRAAMLNVHYGTQMADDYNRKIPRLLRKLAPHLRNAIEINRRLADPLLNSPTISTLIEAHTDPTFLLDGAGRLRAANRSAVRLVQEGRDTMLDAFDGLVPRDPAVARQLAAMRLFKGNRAGGVVEMSSRTVEGEVIWCAVAVPVMPIGNGELEWLAAPGMPLIVTVRKVAINPPLSPSELCSRFGLTPAEARLAGKIGMAERLEHAAELLGITYETARTRLKVVFAKTDTHRQTELVALFARLSGERKARLGITRA